MILVEDNEIITERKVIAEIKNEYLMNITKSLNIPECIINEHQDLLSINDIEGIIAANQCHLSILKIKQYINNYGFNFNFEYSNVIEIRKEILSFDFVKATGPDNIP